MMSGSGWMEGREVWVGLLPLRSPLRGTLLNWLQQLQQPALQMAMMPTTSAPYVALSLLMQKALPRLTQFPLFLQRVTPK